MTEVRHRSGAHRIAASLGPEARALISAARRGDDPSACDRARVRRALLAAMAGTAVAGGATASAAAASGGVSAASGTGALSSAGAGGVLATGTVATTTTAVGGATIATGGATIAGGALLGSSLLAKVAAVVLAVGATGGALAVGTIASAPESVGASVPRPAHRVASVPVSREEAGPTEAPKPGPATANEAATTALAPVARELAPAPAPIARASRPVASAPRGSRIAVAETRPAPESPPPLESSAPPAAQLGDEMPLVRAAWSALRAGRPEDALAALAEHRQRFPHGVLAPERDAAHAVALCATGRPDEGARAADAFFSAHPRSPLASRVRSACGR